MKPPNPRRGGFPSRISRACRDKKLYGEGAEGVCAARRVKKTVRFRRPVDAKIVDIFITYGYKSICHEWHVYCIKKDASIQTNLNVMPHLAGADPYRQPFCVGVPSGRDQAAGCSFTAGLPHKTRSGSVCGGRPLPAERRPHERQRVRPSPVEHAI